MRYPSAGSEPRKPRQSGDLENMEPLGMEIHNYKGNGLNLHGHGETLGKDRREG